jgi:integrase
MPVEPKGPRLWFKRGNKLADGTRAQGYWVIKDDGGVRVSTGIRAARRGKPPQEAQDALAAYIVSKRQVNRERGRDAAAVLVADVINIYLQDRASTQARPEEVAQRCTALLSFWGDKTLAQVTGRTCRAYVEHRREQEIERRKARLKKADPALTTGIGAARRELEDLRAAINHHRKEGLCREVVEVVLPEAGAPRDRWLTRKEAAKLIWAAWRYREVQKGSPTGRRSRQHIARFILVGLYTGTRASAVCGASLVPAAHTGWIDLERGVFYRKASAERGTKKRKPPVRLPARLLAHMKRWHKNGQMYAIEWLGEPVGTGVEKAFKRTCEDAGLEHVTPHTLRHTAATWLMQRGTDIWEAAGYLGMTTETLEKTYGHHHPDYQSQAAENITKKA